MKEKPKNRHKSKLLQYLSDPANEFPTRAFLSTEVLGYKSPTQIHQTFTPAELREIEAEALEERRKRYVPRLSKIDLALLNRAEKDGDPAACKLVYQRIEGWSEKNQVELTGKDGGAMKHEWTVKVVEPDKPEIDVSRNQQIVHGNGTDLKIEAKN